MEVYHLPYFLIISRHIFTPKNIEKSGDQPILGTEDIYLENFHKPTVTVTVCT